MFVGVVDGETAPSASTTSAAAPTTSTPRSTGPNVIIDTDLSRWWDDATAIGIANVLQQQGKVNVLGIVSDIRNPMAVAAIDAIDTAYGHADIPLGAVAHSDADTAPHGYSDVLARRLPHTVGDSDDVPDGRRLYRQLLARQPDAASRSSRSVRTRTWPGSSPRRPAAQLVTAKVKRLVIMDGALPRRLGRSPIRSSTSPPRDRRRGRNRTWLRGRRRSRGSTASTGSAPGRRARCARRRAADNPMRIVYETLFKCGPLRDGDWDAPALLFAIGDVPRVSRSSAAAARP